MRGDFKWIISLISLGVMLTSYAHTSFMGKADGIRLNDDLKSEIVSLRQEMNDEFRSLRDHIISLTKELKEARNE